MKTLRFSEAGEGHPFHAAHVTLHPRLDETVWHGHADFYEFMWVTTGSGHHQLPDGGRWLEPGELTLVRPGDRHAFIPARDGLAFMNVAFPQAAWDGLLAMVDDGHVAGWAAADSAPVLRPHDPDTADLAFREALNRVAARPSGADLVAFLAGVLRSRPGAAAPRTTLEVPRPPEWLSVTCEAMRDPDNLRDGLSAMLRLARVSHGHLARQMRLHHGLTPVEFVTDLRLHHAAGLLTSTDLPVTEIALRSGFSSQSYFTRRFHALHGLAPRQFRTRAQRRFVPAGRESPEGSGGTTPPNPRP